MEKLFIKSYKKYGYLWIYKNEIVSDIEKLDPGSLAKIYEQKTKKFIGVGYINPKSTIAVRLLSFKNEEINIDFLRNRIKKALEYRENILGLKDSYRVIYSESDFLPGLIVDKYSNCIVIQVLTAGIENFKDEIIKVIDEIFDPKIIVLRNDSQSRLKEGLKIERKIVKGDLKELPVITEIDMKFKVDPIHGQKTGFFLDQRENRVFLRNLINAGQGVDLFCYTGAWGLHLAKTGATVIGIDSSEYAIKLARENAELNNLTERCSFVKADVFDFLRWEIKKDKKYDFVIADPPAFVKSKEEKSDAIEGYITLNSLLLKLLKKDGILATSSCSHHISDEDFFEIIKEAFRRSKKYGKILYQGTQSRDHPILTTMPETKYLKCLIIKLFD
ncbi:MAG: class I SAM-dependent rRNA methyltransferase [Thermodesulfovibrionaceae bacterium]